MDPIVNPYRPGAGRRPPVLAGRRSLLEAFDVLRTRAERFGEGDRSWVLNGLRGVGKTVLLGELLQQVSGRGWITAKVEATGGGQLPVLLSRALTRGMRTASGRHPEPPLRRLLAVFSSFSLRFDPTGGVSVATDISPAAGVADSGRFADDLAALFDVMGTTARELGIGVLILIDELQEATADELRALNTAVHELGQAGVPLPVVVVAAGLPSLPAQLGDATSYAERLYDYRTIGALDATGSREALVAPAHALGVEWDPAALELAVNRARGYPFLLQSIGKHVWDNAVGSPISTDDAAAGLVEAQREVDEGLYRSRWERATPAQRDVLRALATVAGDDAAPVADVARQAGKARTGDISVARNELIRKGLVFAPERGLLAFTVPGMSEFVLRQE